MEKIPENTVSQLLTGVAEVRERFEAQWQKTGEKYNIFKVAEIAHKEIVMCRVIADLLNPRGKHCQGSRCLSLFWKTISPKLPVLPALKIEDTKVTTEYGTDENRRIDITLEDGRIFVPIEVKIRAGDQQKQIADYYESAKKKNNVNVPVLYITIDGHEPLDFSKDGIGKDAYVPLSFKDDILAWLEKCRDDTPETMIPVRENLKQLIAAVKSLCGKSEDKIMDKAIAELIIKSEDSIHAAVAISSALQEFNNESKELFKGSILDMVKKELPQAWKYTDEGWHGIGVPLLSDQYDLFIDYDWKTININRSDAANLVTEEKLSAKMSEITRCDKEIWGDIVWATSKARYPGMENVDNAYYYYELYRQYAKNPDGVAREIVSIVQALEKLNK